MMSTRTSSPEAVEAAICMTGMILNKLTFKMINAKNKELRDLFEARAERTHIKLQALLALQNRERAAHAFYTASDNVAARLSMLRQTKDTCRQAVRAHTQLYTS